MIIVSVGSREGAREAPAPLSQGLDDPPLPPPPYVKVCIRHSALEGGKARKMTRELLEDTIARRKGQDE